MEKFSLEEENFMESIEENLIRNRGYSNEELDLMDDICCKEIIIEEDSEVEKYLDDIIKNLDLMFGDSNIVFEYLNKNFPCHREWLENLYFLEGYGFTKDMVEMFSK